MARKSTPATNKITKAPKSSRRTSLDDHRSLNALKAEAEPGEGLEDVIRRKCRAMVTHAKQFGWSGPPFDPRELASIYGIRVEETDEDFGSEGRIFPRKNDVIIECRAGRGVERQRFTICHELAHTCFPDAFEFVRNHLDDSRDDRAHKKFENLCDVGAAELLMPHDEFCIDAESGAICLEHMNFLRGRYISSIEATLKRALDLTNHSCAALFLTDEAFNEFHVVPGQLRVRWMWKSQIFNAYFRPGTLVSKSSMCLRAVSEVCPPFPKSRETLWINSKPRSYYVEAIQLPAIDGLVAYPKVAALIHGRLPS